MPLPQELVDIIVDNLIIAGDVPSLKSCALAARTFVRSARTHLFQKIEISAPSSSNGCRQFYEILSSSPEIAPLVKELRIVLKGSNTFFAYNMPETNAEECRGVCRFSADKTLSLVLCRLVNLTQISLVGYTPQGWYGGHYSMNWGVMEEHLKSALARVFSSPKLEAVYLRGFAIESPNQLLSLFSEAAALKEMSLSHLHFTHLVRWQGSRLWRPRLRSLLINDSGGSPCGRYVVDPRICLSHVATLTVATQSIEWRDQVIQATGVEHLRLRVWSETSFARNMFTKLRSIHLHCYWILSVLGGVFTMCPLDSDTPLEQIIIDGPGAIHLLVVHEDRYDSRVDAIVAANLGHLPALRRVELRRTKDRLDTTDTFAEWEAAVQAALPSLMRRNMLLTTEIESGYEWE
ncbi:hypothetical protein MSAN_02200400 [Mycena sanguinolenta]|uniref:Uncharacterized protein n=1 Tax=Mycena sanguinolenta TaxID=230812 RepID=A0A8H6XE31_9AGAR|nr:hypothetical protein MSAN_02200400 [Mycena sanguinolenta]